jgi:hypothetical protein
MKPSNWQSFPIPSSIETRNFLMSSTDAENELTRQMWNSATGLRGLLTARRLASAQMNKPKGEKDYVYNQVTGQYRDTVTGRPLSEKQIRTAVMRVSADAQKQLRDETRQLMAGTIMFIVWYTRSRIIMKALYKAIWVLWLGGFLFDDQTQRELFYLFILMQFKRFDDFTMQLDSGRQAFNGTAMTRAGSYGRYGNALHQNIKLDLAISQRQHDQARRVLGMNEDHCENAGETFGCIELALRGWIPIREMIPLGSATCRASCLCIIETRRRPTHDSL